MANGVLNGKMSANARLLNPGETFGDIGTFPNPEIKALSLTQLNTSGGRRNM